ncbi:ImmA/IrrE family metallo-endopeptidase [Amycolatopsis thermoflava]|uniref:ImmA/IrrE family metallo-endopeptidase n=1 Tax=Amycolatopsis thermoflava TaxID=84480 RepID=UPI003D74CAAA
MFEWLGEVRQLIDLGWLPALEPLTFPGKVDGPSAAREAARWVREHLGLGVGPIDTMMSVCERAGQFLLVTELTGDGASLTDDGLAVAVVNSAADPGRRRATAAHELGHLVLGDEYSTDLGVAASREDRERAIDAFAAELLLPVSVVSESWPQVEALGWAPQPDLTSVTVPPSFAHAVMEAWRSDQITSDRAVELLHGRITIDDLPPRDDAELAP